MTDEPAPPVTPPPDPTETLRQQLTQANQRLVHAELKSHAIRAGIIDVDGLKLLDMTDVTLDDHGNIPEAANAITRLKRDKPWLFINPNSSHPAPTPAPETPKTKTARDMSYSEWQTARARLLKGR